MTFVEYRQISTDSDFKVILIRTFLLIIIF